MKYLALDIGKRHTGVAFGDSSIGIPLPLETIAHTTIDALVKEIIAIVYERNIDEIVVGFPLLPSGKKGSQALFTEQCIEKLNTSGLRCSTVDERYTTAKDQKSSGHASAACLILETKFMRNQ